MRLKFRPGQLAVALSLIMLVQCLSVPGIQAEGNAPATGETVGSWIIEAWDDLIYENGTLQMKHNITIEPLGKLTLRNYEIEVHGDLDGSIGIHVKEEAILILDNVTIHAAGKDQYYRFYVLGNAIIEHSDIRHIWGERAADGLDGGLFLVSDDSRINDTYIGEGLTHGLHIIAEGPKVENCTISNNGGVGIFLDYAGFNRTQYPFLYNNIVSNNNDTGLFILRSRVRMVGMRVESNKNSGMTMFGSAADIDDLVMRDNQMGVLTSEFEDEISVLVIDGGDISSNIDQGVVGIGGYLILSNLTVNDNGKDGVNVVHTMGSVENCVISGNGGVGINLNDSEITMKNLELRENYIGIYSLGALLSAPIGYSLLSNVTSRDNDLHGVFGNLTKLVINNSAFTGNGADGADLDDSDVEISNSTFSNNTYNGLDVVFCMLSISRSIMDGNGQYGLIWYDSAGETVFNRMHDNFLTGAYITQDPLIERLLFFAGNDIHNSGESGLVIEYSLDAKVVNNNISDNFLHGIEMKESNMIIANNTIARSGLSGMIFSDSIVYASNNTIINASTRSDNPFFNNGMTLLNSRGELVYNTILGGSNDGLFMTNSFLGISNNSISEVSWGIFSQGSVMGMWNNTYISVRDGRLYSTHRVSIQVYDPSGPYQNPARIVIYDMDGVDILNDDTNETGYVFTYLFDKAIEPDGTIVEQNEFRVVVSIGDRTNETWIIANRSHNLVIWIPPVAPTDNTFEILLLVASLGGVALVAVALLLFIRMKNNRDQDSKGSKKSSKKKVKDESRKKGKSK